jgi:hypothetical protein
VLAALLLLQLTLLGSGTLRAFREIADTSSASPHTMPSMPGMAEHQRATGALAQQDEGRSPSVPTGCDAEGGPHGCGLPWSSGSCAVMTACVNGAALPSIAAANDERTMSAGELPDPALLLAGAIAAPELPPPRA